jgi:DUF1680 family protein
MLQMFGTTAAASALQSVCLDAPSNAAEERALQAQPISKQFVPVGLDDVKVGGEIGRRIALTVKNNLLALDVDRDFLSHFQHKDARDGYIAMGKLIDASVKFAYYTKNDEVLALKTHLVQEIIKTQGSDGYIGDMIPEKRMWTVWDLHEMGYIIYGLVSEYECFGNKQALTSAKRAADYIINNWSTMPVDWANKQEIAVHVAATGMDRTMVALYKVTGEQCYLDFELKQRNLLSWDPGIVLGRRPLVLGHTYAYMAASLAQLELYRIVPSPKLLGATTKALHFMTAENGMGITGGVGQAEVWTDDQDGGRDLQETCSTCYQIRVYEHLLRLTANSYFGDFMERTIWNTLFGAQSPDGSHLRYFTPIQGGRVYVGECCCTGNFRRIISELPTMVYYRSGNGVAVNLYSTSEAKVPMDDESSIAVRQETDYPTSGQVLIRVDPSQPASFPLKLRIPSWCNSARISVNGKEVDMASTPGSFASVERRWQAGDQLRLDMNMEWRLVRGRQRQAGRVAVMRGPLVFTLNPQQDTSLAGKNADDLGRIVIDKLAIEQTPMRSVDVRPDGIGCRLKAGTTVGALGDDQSTTLTLTEFADPDGKCVYFKIPDMSQACNDELTSGFV